MNREIKTFKFEVKEVDEEEGTFTGYAATFSKIPDSYGDIIDPGAFKKTIKERNKQIKILWNHYILEPIGRPTKLEEDEKGLYLGDARGFGRMECGGMTGPLWTVRRRRVRGMVGGGGPVGEGSHHLDREAVQEGAFVRAADV